MSQLSLFVSVLLLTTHVTAGVGSLIGVARSHPSSPHSELQTNPSPKVNAPYFEGDVRFSETAIFWFGRVTPTENYVDVRVGYNDSLLYVRAGIIDRRLWYDTSPSADELTDWDAITLYLDLDGNAGSVPDENAYRFDAQLVWWEERDPYQLAYQGNGTEWVTATVPFTTTSFYQGTAPNNDQNDRGWALSYQIPFDSLGLTGPPPQGTRWGLALACHDRDDAAGTPILTQVWPTVMKPEQPSTWGTLAFGVATYTPPAALPGDTITIRHGLDGATVVDGHVGGSSVCGSAAWPEYFPTWGELNYAGQDFLNIQNLGPISEWPCFSKAYVTFPLDPIPTGRGIISATLTMYLWGGAGEGQDPGPQPSFIQVLVVGEDWEEGTITWNNAPLALENVSGTWVDPVDPYPGRPGIPYHWDVSGAVAEAYEQRTPLRLALYESDWAYHSGKYFDSSDVDEWGALGRPTLDVTWGQLLADIEKSAFPSFGYVSDPITYTLSFLGTGRTLHLTDTLPMGVSAPSVLELSGTSVSPTYDAAHHRLIWSDAVSAGQKVIIRYGVMISTSARSALVNGAELAEENGSSSSAATATVIANPYSVYLPCVARAGE